MQFNYSDKQEALNMQKVLFTILITVLLTVSCSSKNKKSKSAKFKPAKIVKIAQVGTFKKLWSQKLNGGKKSYGYRLIPFVDRNTIYVASVDGKVIALDSETGKSKWSVELGQELSAGPGVGSKTLMVGTPEGQVIALDKTTGNQMWSKKVSSEILTPPVIDNQVAVVRAQDGKVFALDSLSGSRLWLFDTNIPNLTLRGNSEPVVKAGRAYIGFDNGKVAAIKLSSGDVIWLQNVVDTKGKTELARIVDIDGDMALIATDLYLSSAVGKTISVATESGRVMWAKDIGSAAGVTASRSNLFVIDNQSNVHALDRADGTEEWSTSEYTNRALTKPAFYLGDVVVGDLEGYLHVIDGTNGNTIARTRVGKRDFYSQPIVSGSMLIAYNKDGTLTVLEYTR